MNDKSKNAIVEIRDLLKECVEYGHYPNWNFTKEKLKKIASYEKIISKEEYLVIEKICQEVIFPTYFDENYRKSFCEKELGNYNEGGFCSVNSEEDADRMVSAIYKKCVELCELIDRRFFEIWNLEFNQEEINIQKKYIETKSKDAIIEIYGLLKECIEPNNLFNLEFVKKNIEKVSAYKEIISDEENDAIKHICEDVIFSVYDEKNREFIFNEELGHHNEEGFFVFNSEEAEGKAISLLLKKSIKLGKQIDKLFLEIWNLKFD